MTLNLADKYYLKALEEFDYNLEEVAENLNYALSYDPAHSGANELMGRLYLYEFGEFEMARAYFEDALASNPANTMACESLTWLFIRTGELDEALKLIDYSFSLTGIRMDTWLRLKAQVYERKKEYAEAKALLKTAMEESFDSSFISFLRSELYRVESKLNNSLSIRYSYDD